MVGQWIAATIHHDEHADGSVGVSQVGNDIGECAFIIGGIHEQLVRLLEGMARLFHKYQADQLEEIGVFFDPVAKQVVTRTGGVISGEEELAAQQAVRKPVSAQVEDDNRILGFLLLDHLPYLVHAGEYLVFTN